MSESRIYDWLPDAEVKSFISNMVYTATLTVKLDLRSLCLKLKSKGISYNPKKFAACIFRFKSTRLVVLLFKDGELVCTGAKSIHQARYIINKIISYLKEAGYKKVKFANLKLENLVVAVTLPYPVQNKRFYDHHLDIAAYNEGSFPGVIIRHKELQNITGLLFKSGQMVLTGLKVKEDIERALNKLGPIIAPYLITNKDCKEVIAKMYHPNERDDMSDRITLEDLKTV